MGPKPSSTRANYFYGDARPTVAYKIIYAMEQGGFQTCEKCIYTKLLLLKCSFQNIKNILHYPKLADWRKVSVRYLPVGRLREPGRFRRTFCIICPGAIIEIQTLHFEIFRVLLFHYLGEKVSSTAVPGPDFPKHIIRPR